MLTLFVIFDVAVLVAIIAGLLYFFFGSKEKKQPQIKFSYLNEKHQQFSHELHKNIAEREGAITGVKVNFNETADPHKPKEKRTFVLKFKGGVTADEVEVLRHEITAVLMVAKAGTDEVVVKLESPGGTVNGYGLAASQLQRIKDGGIKLTVAIDSVAASGGYLMASVANNIVAAPFAYIGSVGVVSEFPNFNELIERFGVKWKTYTAGESKRDVGQFGKITPDAEKRHNAKLKDIHKLFKNHIKSSRPFVNVNAIATGEVWAASEALKLKLVDVVKVSDEYIIEQMLDSNVYNVYTPETKSKMDRVVESIFGMAIKQVKALLLESRTEKF